MKIILKRKIINQLQKKPRIYIVPSKAGLKYLVVNFLFFLVALSFSNNTALIITFLMISYFIIQMLDTHQVIQQLDFKSLSIKNTYSDSKLPIDVLFHKNIKPNKNIGIKLYTKDQLNFILRAQEISTHHNYLRYKAEAIKRGHYKIDKVQFYHKGAHQLFYVWRYISISDSFYIYPKKTIPSHYHQKVNFSQASTGDKEYHEHRPYEQGHHAYKIDWKIYAKTDELLYKDYKFFDQKKIQLNYNELKGNKEERLEYLSFLIDKCLKEKTTWSLILPHKTLKSSKGITHFRHSMEAISIV